MGGIEVGAIFATRAGKDHNVRGTVDAAGILPVVLLGLGFFPQYIGILRLRSVVGVSMMFITADAAGSVFSIISLVFRDKFDILATMNYAMVFICDLIVVAFYVYYNKLHPELAKVPPKDIQEMDNDNEVSGQAEPSEISEVRSYSQEKETDDIKSA
ncbi:hypothetical protein BGZ76_007544 [Entomortierella beljakovae]|nr:hypothetical protein BGZ76_007544 [Entomortierella beljakovae]